MNVCIMLRCHLHTSNHDYNSKKIKGQIKKKGIGLPLTTYNSKRIEGQIKKKGIGLTLTTYDNREIIKRKPSAISE